MPTVSVMTEKLRDIVPTSLGKWFLIWTAIGVCFSLQLRWHYGASWPLSVFWGLSDWYLWSFLALGIFIGVRQFNELDWPVSQRVAVYAVAAPVFAALHVILTMLVGGADEAAQRLGWGGYFVALYTKKLTLNMLTVGVLIAVGEFLTKRQPRPAPVSPRAGFLAKRGDISRLISPEDIIWGEVCGNYVNLQTPDGAWLVHKTLTQTLTTLSPDDFLKVNRSRFVRIAQVRSMRSAAGKLDIILSDGTELSVARRQQANVRRALRSQVDA